MIRGQAYSDDRLSWPPGIGTCDSRSWCPPAGSRFGGRLPAWTGMEISNYTHSMFYDLWWTK